MNLLINGERRTLPPLGSLADVLAALELDARTVVVEHNRVIVRRPALATTGVHDGDQIEVVHFVGGG